MNKDCDPSCGLCCSRIPADILTQYGLPVSEAGIGCAHLNSEKRCDIYEDRPDICRTEAVWKNIFGPIFGCSYESYLDTVQEMCHALQENSGWRKEGS